MNHFDFRSLFAAVTIGCLMFPGVRAQESMANTAIAKYLDSQSIVVGWIDISKIDLYEFNAFQEKLGQPPQTNMAEVKATRDALVQLKVNRIYWISDLAGLMKGPESIVIPTPNPSAVAVLLQAINPTSAPDNVFEVDGDFLIGTTKQAVSNLRDKTGDVVPIRADQLGPLENRVE